jgi:hypothetical protein
MFEYTKGVIRSNKSMDRQCENTMASGKMAATPYQGKKMIGTTSSGISYQLRDIYSIYRCCWDLATYKWKVHTVIEERKILTNTE